MKIGLLVAMDSEYRALCNEFGGDSRGVVAGNQLVVSRCGIGKVNAAVGTMRLIETEHPDCVISTGVAGGIDRSLDVMDVVVADETAYHDVWCGEGNEKGQVQGLPARFVSDRRLAEAALKCGVSNVKHGLTCTGDQFITDKEALSRIKADFPDGLAVDMESAAIAQVCFLMQVPFLSIRIVSDTPGATPDHFAQYQDFWKELSERSFRNIHAMLEQMPASL